MIRITAALFALALLTACTMPPKGVDDLQLAAWDEAVASIGCELSTESDYLPVELQTGLSRAQVQEIASYKVKTGVAEPNATGGVRLITGTCTPAAPAPEADVMAEAPAAG
ncbi:hypothetical protein [Salipiger sp. PrR002]|uniref:hypothetical protein n=1 Tax=Salipiger sp. PrR002 TaxID=2706489 RepID=UPI0013B6B7B9|nr:hypothetical protein [Salipiger sp. PrR002]NDV97880.1 hypothetical protein [Salipiger sp. PrR002]NDW55371.1 hypothetical protein [Salipiger sp. PrR004]